MPRKKQTTVATKTNTTPKWQANGHKKPGRKPGRKSALAAKDLKAEAKPSAEPKPRRRAKSVRAGSVDVAKMLVATHKEQMAYITGRIDQMNDVVAAVLHAAVGDKAHKKGRPSRARANGVAEEDFRSIAQGAAAQLMADA